MSENKKDSIKLIDINNDNFFKDDSDFFEKNAKSSVSDGFVTKLVVFAVLLSFLLIGIVVFVPFDKINGAKTEKTLIKSEIAKSEKESFNLFKTRENILLLGVDSNGVDTDPFKDTRTDTIMLVSFDKHSKSASIISIPRDSKVYIEGHGIDKINSAHAVGGIDLTLKTVQKMFGVKIDHYMLINYDGLKEIIKVLGTIPVHVEKKLRYNDYSGKLFIKLNEGKQELNAEQVEQFARFRHDALGDIGRISRQRMLMKGVIEKLQSPESITKLPEVISTASKYILTDMTIFDMTRYAGIAKNINTDDIVIATLPGHPSQNSYVSYWILEPDRVQAIINRLVYREEKNTAQNEPIKVSLLYSENYANSIDTIKENLAEKSINVICDKQTQKHVPEIIVHSDNVTFEKYKYLKTILPPLKKAPMTLSYDLFYCGESDVTLILAN